MTKFEDTFIGRPNTIKTYLSLFRRHIKPLNIDWTSWNDDKTSMILRSWEREGLSRNSRLTLLRLLGRYVQFRGGPKLDTQRFARSLERSEQQTEVTALTTVESKKLMEAAQRLEPRFYPVLLLALHAGLRRGEIFGLRCSDIDILHGKIKVSHSYDGPTKSGRSRIVPMSPELEKVILGARNALLRGSSEKVFEQFNPNPVLRRLCVHAGVKQIRFHDLRHSFATMALESGVSVKQVSTWLGHASVSTTLNVYWNSTSEKADLSFLPE
jgi:integrase